MKTELFALADDHVAGQDRKFNESLSRGLEILRAFRPGDGFLGNQDIAQRTGLPKATVTRFTYTLTRLGYLKYSERLEKYQLGSGVLALGYAFLSNLTIRQLAQPMMQELADATCTGVGLADRDRLDMIYVEYTAPRDVMTFRHSTGVRIPMAVSALGRAYLAALPASERDYFISYIRKRHGGDADAIIAGIEQGVAQYRERGYTSSMGELDRDVNGVAVPVILSDGVVYALNAGGPSFRLAPEFLENEVAPQLKNLARNIEAMLIRY